VRRRLQLRAAGSIAESRRPHAARSTSYSPAEPPLTHVVHRTMRVRWWGYSRDGFPRPERTPNTPYASSPRCPRDHPRERPTTEMRAWAAPRRTTARDDALELRSAGCETPDRRLGRHPRAVSVRWRSVVLGDVPVGRQTESAVPPLDGDAPSAAARRPFLSRSNGSSVATALHTTGGGDARTTHYRHRSN
jgi:hypothetical protein